MGDVETKLLMNCEIPLPEDWRSQADGYLETESEDSASNTPEGTSKIPQSNSNRKE